MEEKREAVPGEGRETGTENRQSSREDGRAPAGGDRERGSKPEEKKENPLGYAPIGKLLLKFALPAVISMLVNALYNIVDQIFIGQGVGYLGNAATTVAFPVATIILAVSTMLGAGGSAYAAIKLGEKEEEQAERTLGNVFALLTVIGVAAAAAGLIFLKPMLWLFGATDSIMEYSVQYTSILLLGAPFNMLGIGLSNMARTDGSPSLSMYSILAGAILNVILDPIYIFVFHWGVAGAAVATITSQIISAVVLIIYFVTKSNMRLKRENLVLDPQICRNILILGISSGITQVAATILQIVMNNSLVRYGSRGMVGGDVALSAMGVISKIGMIIIAVCIGIGIGSQPILGFNRGAGQPVRIKKTYIRAAVVATAASVAGWLACQCMPHLILRLFGTENGVFTDFAVKGMRIYMLGICTAGFQIVSTSYFQATGQPLKASLLSMLRQLILLIPMILLLPVFFGLDGILYAGPVADLGSFFIVTGFMWHEMKSLNSQINGEGLKRSEAV